MKTALAAAFVVAFATLPATAQHPLEISTATRPLQADNAQLPPACRDKPLPTKITGHAYAGDGDTITFVGHPTRVRIWGIQAPELRDQAKVETVPGMRARARLEELLAAAGHKVVCQPAKWDRYCRYVAFCETLQMDDAAGLLRTPQDVGWRLLDEGLAYGFWLEDTFPGRPELSNWYASAEAKARAERKGLWPLWLGAK